MSENNNIELLQFENLLQYPELRHFSTTRKGGYSQGILKGFNLGYTVGDNPQNVTKNIELLQNSVVNNQSKIVFPKQTHSKNIGIVEKDQNTFSNTDALITNISGICIAIRTADCVPVLLFDPIQKVVAAIHSGWKGTIQKISQKTIEIMQHEFGTNPQHIVAGIGPSIGPAVYEIGPEVADQYKEQFPNNNLLVSIQDSDKSLLNLWEANKQILLDSGVPEKNIEIAEMCTYSNPELFYSARRDGVKCGRLATGIMLV